jgi:hypothetical protein
MEQLYKLLRETEKTGCGKYYFGLYDKGKDGNSYFLILEYKNGDKKNYFIAYLRKKKNDNIYHC